jgi:hypothetical protein
MTLLDDRLRRGIEELADDLHPSRDPDDVLAELKDGARPGRAADGHRRPHRGWALVGIAAFVLLAVVAGVLVVRAGDSSQPVHLDTVPTPVPATSEWDPAELGAGWHALPPGPLDGYLPTAMVWTGTDLVAWRGYESEGEKTRRSAALDPRAGVWTQLPEDPLGLDSIVGEVGGGAWSGDEAVFWTSTGIAAWNPAAGTWRASESPSPTSGHAVWTGGQVVFWHDGWTYDPANDTWESLPLPPSPIGAPDGGAAAVWTGDELVVVSGEVNLSLDVDAGSWSSLPATELQPGWDTWTVAAAQIGDEIWMIDGRGAPAGSVGYAFSLSERTWRQLTAEEFPPNPGSEGAPEMIQVGEVLYVVHAGLQSQRVGDGPWEGPQVTYTGTSLVVGAGLIVASGRPENPFMVYVPFEPVPGPAGPSISSGWVDLGAVPPEAGSIPWMVADQQRLYMWNPSTDGGTYGAGFVLDLRSGEWGPAPALPAARGGDVRGGVWADFRVIAWSPDGVHSWLPGADAWETDTPPGRDEPLRSATDPFAPAWTGDELLFWADGLAYRPSDRTWRSVALVPHEYARVWTVSTEGRVHLVGLVSDSIPDAATSTTYDIASDTWTDPIPAPISGQWLGLAAAGDRVVAVDYAGKAAWLQASGGEWTELPDVPIAEPLVDWLGVTAIPRRDGDGVLVTSDSGGWALPGGVGWVEVLGTPDRLRSHTQWADLVVAMTETELWLYRP